MPEYRDKGKAPQSTTKAPGAVYARIKDNAPHQAKEKAQCGAKSAYTRHGRRDQRHKAYASKYV